jgi:hypothetical protein
MNELELNCGPNLRIPRRFEWIFIIRETPLASLSAAENQVATKDENGKFFGRVGVFCSKQKIVFVEKIFSILVGWRAGLIAAVGGSNSPATCRCGVRSKSPGFR